MFRSTSRNDDIEPRQAYENVGSGAVLVDVREPNEWAAGHATGAVHLCQSGSRSLVATKIATERGRTAKSVRGGTIAWARAGLARIDHEGVLSHLEGGMAAWRDASLPVAGVVQSSADELGDQLRKGALTVLDVRTDAAWADGHIAGARHIVLNDLPDRIDDVPDERTVRVICGSGYRSSIATSLLLRAGRKTIVNVVGGMDAWYAAGHPTTTESVETKYAGEVRA